MQAPPSLTETYVEFCARCYAEGLEPLSERAWNLVRWPLSQRAMREALRNCRWASPTHKREVWEPLQRDGHGRWRAA